MRTPTLLLSLATLGLTSALGQPAQGQPTRNPAPRTVPVPRERVSLTCADTYFKSPRQNFLLVDETYPACTLRLPLALRERWPEATTFFLIPRVSATLYAKDGRGQGHWLPLSPLVNAGPDPLHRAVASDGYQAVELTGRLGKVSDVAADKKPDTVSVGGKLTVCAAPMRVGEDSCVTYDIAARYRVYTR